MSLAVMDWEDRFLPEILLPSQYYQPRVELTPLAHLMLGVFMVAWEDVQRLKPQTSWQKREELREWFFGKWDGPFSLQTICEVLDTPGASWNIDQIRQAVAATALAPARITSGRRVLTPVCGEGHTLRLANMVSTKYGRVCRECYVRKHPNRLKRLLVK